MFALNHNNNTLGEVLLRSVFDKKKKIGKYLKNWVYYS